VNWTNVLDESNEVTLFREEASSYGLDNPSRVGTLPYNPLLNDGGLGTSLEGTGGPRWSTTTSATGQDGRMEKGMKTLREIDQHLPMSEEFIYALHKRWHQIISRIDGRGRSHASDILALLSIVRKETGIDYKIE
jgi:hypothetical protein